MRIGRDIPLLLAMMLAGGKLVVASIDGISYQLGLLPSDTVFAVFVLDLTLLTSAMQGNPFDPDKKHLLPTPNHLIGLVLVLVAHLILFFVLYQLHTKQFMADYGALLSLGVGVLTFGGDYEFLRRATDEPLSRVVEIPFHPFVHQATAVAS